MAKWTCKHCGAEFDNVLRDCPLCGRSRLDLMDLSHDVFVY
jgi:rubredoxin